MSLYGVEDTSQKGWLAIDAALEKRPKIIET